MPVTTVYSHGMTGGCPPRVNSHLRALRGAVGGWSDGAARRNTLFLFSVQDQALVGVGFAVTLTLRDCPGTSDEWHRLRRAWSKRVERLGMTYMHWVTEWQRRGVPHMHGAVWFPAELVESVGAERLKREMLGDWIEVAADFGAGWGSQLAHLITGAVGWFQYMSKHASRGVKHYQRSSENVPPAWQKKTGRMWGHWGKWPLREGIKVTLQDQYGDGGWFAFRRLVRSWRVADARKSGNKRREVMARAMLKCHEIHRSRVRGVREWIPEEAQLAFLANLAGRGFSVTS